MYYVQTKSKAGNFVDYLGTKCFETAKDTRKYLVKKGETVIVVRRMDIKIIDEKGKRV